MGKKEGEIKGRKVWERKVGWKEKNWNEKKGKKRAF